MRNPLTISGPRVLLASPDQSWERVAMPICEGPQVLRRNGDLFIVYSASGSWTPDYCMGLLHNRGGDVLNPATWRKHGPVFEKSEDVWGVGPLLVREVLLPAGRLDDLSLQNPAGNPGWEDRDVHAKRFEWTSEGFPEFGSPMPRNARSTKTLAQSAAIGAAA